jgi:predicted PurR-regulated permease PerM
VVRTVTIVVACAIALYLLWRVRVVVRLVGISLFLALALLPVVDAPDNRIRVPRALLILAVYVLLIASAILVGYVVIPSLVKQVGQRLVRDARRLPHLLTHLAGPRKDVTVQAFALIGQLLTVLAISFLLVLHRRQYVNIGLSLTGERSQRYRRLIIDINHAVAQYVLGNITISVLATVATWIVLSILGVPYALSLGFVVGFFDLIPLLGATLGRSSSPSPR